MIAPKAGYSKLGYIPQICKIRIMPGFSLGLHLQHILSTSATFLAHISSLTLWNFLPPKREPGTSSKVWKNNKRFSPHHMSQAYRKISEY